MNNNTNSTSWTMVLKRLPESMNSRERSSFWVRKKELDEITQELAILSVKTGVPRAEGKRWAKVTIHKSLRSRKTDDPANRDSRAKSPLDALVNLGLLVDDNDRWLEWRGVHEGERLKDKCTVIEIGEVS